MADKKVIVHVGEDYVTGIIDKTFLNDDEANGRNGDAYYAAASATTLVWNMGSGAWEAWDPNLNSNEGIDPLMFGMTTGVANDFGPDIGYVRLLEAELGASDPLHLFKFASNATLESDAAYGSWQKDPTAFNSANDVFAVMTAQWVAAKAILSSDVLRVQAIIVSVGRQDAIQDKHQTFVENLKQFIKDLRYLFLEDADDDPIPVIITKLGSLSGGTYDTIQDGYDEVASTLPYTLALDIDANHIATVLDERSGFGNILLGRDIYDKISLVTTGDQIEEYNLKALRSSIRRQFGIKASDTEQTAIIDEKLNEAILWIAKQRSDWPWLIGELSIDVSAKLSESTADHTNIGIDGTLRITGTAIPSLEVGQVITLSGFDTVANNKAVEVKIYTSTLVTLNVTTGLVEEAAATAQKLSYGPSIAKNERRLMGMSTSVKIRDIFIGGSITGSNAEGYLVVSGSRTRGFRLQSKFLGASLEGATTATIVRGYFKLPLNFSRMLNLELLGDNNVAEKTINTTSLMFDKAKRHKSYLQGLTNNIKTLYCIKPDPIGSSDDQYITLFPYVTEDRILQGVYYKQPAKLISGSDTPDLPRADRFVLLHAAQWFYSSSRKEDAERITFYRVQALQSLKSLMDNANFSEEPDVTVTKDNSGSFIGMPFGYPQVGNLHP